LNTLSTISYNKQIQRYRYVKLREVPYILNADRHEHRTFIQTSKSELFSRKYSFNRHRILNFNWFYNKRRATCVD